MKTKFQNFFIALALLSLTVNIGTAHAQGTAFTYQGQLQNNGAPANGSYDLQFALFNTNATGVAIAGPVTNSATSVSNGLFTTLIDFGNAFNGTSNWLEIAVRTNGNGGFTTLSPRQQITPTPYAITAENLSGVVENNAIQGGVSLATISGGSGNAIQNGANDSTVGGGVNNNIGTNSPIATIGGGANNSIGTNDDTSTIAGGNSNIIQDGAGVSTIAGGVGNQIQTGSPRSTISGGSDNHILNNSEHSTIAGGGGNQIQNTSTYSTISGGQGNMIGVGAFASTIGGGNQNTIQTNDGSSTIAGGDVNTIENDSVASTIGGGDENTIETNSQAATIGGGQVNAVGTNAPFATVSGGFGNTASGGVATVSGGQQNTASSQNATVSGGKLNIASGAFATVGGGGLNTASGATATVSGGQQNMASSQNATVSGGQQNTATNEGATVSGGEVNTAVGQDSTVSGGDNNHASAFLAMVGGGQFNTASGVVATVSGGFNNTATNEGATVSGGEENTASGTNATVPGGELNIASGNFSFAAGFAAEALNNGAFVWADSQNVAFSSTSSNQFLIRAGGGVGINTTSPQQALSVVGGVNVDQNGQNATGNVNNNGLTFGSGSGEGVASQRTGTGNVFDLVLCTKFLPRLTVLQNGFVGVGVTPTTSFQVGLATCNGTTWMNFSDRNSKEDFTAVNPRAVLEKVSALPITEWKYKVEAHGIQHIGPMAQDFHAAFGLDGTDDKHISTIDEGGVALAAIQGLNQKLDEKDSEIQTLRQKNDSLAERLSELEATVKQFAAQK